MRLGADRKKDGNNGQEGMRYGAMHATAGIIESIIAAMIVGRTAWFWNRWRIA
jgi:hypothetical protein